MVWALRDGGRVWFLLFFPLLKGGGGGRGWGGGGDVLVSVLEWACRQIMEWHPAASSTQTHPLPCLLPFPSRPLCREAWHGLAAAALPKLAVCQAAGGGVGLPHTLAALLSLPRPHAALGPEDREAACKLLLQAARIPATIAANRPLVGE
jgi:hypothetical protein